MYYTYNSLAEKLFRRKANCISKKELCHIKIEVHAYRKIPNISHGLIDVFKHILGTYIRGSLYSGGTYIREGLYSRGLTFGGHFVSESEYQDLKIHYYISLLHWYDNKFYKSWHKDINRKCPPNISPRDHKPPKVCLKISIIPGLIFGTLRYIFVKVNFNNWSNSISTSF